ncbi:MAG: fumarylacetoacetate hydrolase family protein, partial [Actinomycetota bacterium]
MAFRLANLDGRAVLIDGDDWHDLAAASAGVFSGDPMEAVRRHAELHEIDLDGRAPDGLVADAAFGAPVPAPRSVFAVGLNYADHANEADMDLPENPLVFTKWPSCLVGPTADVVLAAGAADYEAELVVVIGAGGRDIDAADAWNHVMGLTVGQDISDRALQFAAKPPHFDLGKSRDTYGPFGPAIVSTDLVADPADLA